MKTVSTKRTPVQLVILNRLGQGTKWAPPCIRYCNMSVVTIVNQML